MGKRGPERWYQPKLGVGTVQRVGGAQARETNKQKATNFYNKLFNVP